MNDHRLLPFILYTLTIEIIAKKYLLDLHAPVNKRHPHCEGSIVRSISGLPKTSDPNMASSSDYSSPEYFINTFVATDKSGFEQWCRDSSASKQKKSHYKSRTGCLTCRERKVKVGSSQHAQIFLYTTNFNKRVLIYHVVR